MSIETAHEASIESMREASRVAIGKFVDNGVFKAIRKGEFTRDIYIVLLTRFGNY
jgi:hypothetical protein